MKNLILLLLIAFSNSVTAQDIFQRHFYSPEVIMTYKDEAGISTNQIEKIRNIYITTQSAYYTKQWELNAATAKIGQLIAQTSVDAKVAESQLEAVLALETEIKKMRLAMFISIKNILTAAQQSKLDAHKSEFITESSINVPLNDNQSTTLTLQGSLVPKIPLYVIVDGDGEKETNIDPFPTLNPADIETLQIIRGGKSAIAMYGKKGSNGVIVITLKKKN